MDLTLLLTVFVLAMFRAIVWSERLAFIEVAGCYAVATLAYYRFSAPLSFRLASLLPLAGSWSALAGTGVVVATFLAAVRISFSVCRRMWPLAS